VKTLSEPFDGAQGERVRARFPVKCIVRGEPSRTMNGVFTQSGEARNPFRSEWSSRSNRCP